MLISEMIELAKNGDEYYKEYLYQKYFYIAKRFHQKYHEKISLVEILKIYTNLLDEYYKIDYPLGISAYLIKNFENLLKKRIKVSQKSITELIAEAKKGNKTSRDEIIKHYSYIVEKSAREHHYMEYEDLVQCGMVKLIMLIDNELLNGDGSLFTPRIIKYINFYFNTTLKNEVESEKIEYEYGYNKVYNNDSFAEKVFEIELEELINLKNISSKDKLCALRYFIQKLSLNQIGAIEGCSKQAVSLRVNKVTKKLKHEYIK